MENFHNLFLGKTDKLEGQLRDFRGDLILYVILLPSYSRPGLEGLGSSRRYYSCNLGVRFFLQVL